jgi:hypothetical protein
MEDSAMKRQAPVVLVAALVLASCSDDAISPGALTDDLTPRFHVVPDVTLTGSGTATIDGVLSPGEWDGAGSAAFPATLPAEEGGGTTPSILYVMNDAANLYLAVVVRRVGAVTNPAFEFDNAHDGTFTEGDDGIGMSIGPYEVDFRDVFRTQEYGCPEWAWCGSSDVDHGGSTDGAGAGTVNGGFTYTELAHPLDSADDPFDFSLAPGDVIGFSLLLRLMTASSTVGIRPADEGRLHERGLGGLQVQEPRPVHSVRRDG